jgi:hypothetical protein
MVLVLAIGKLSDFSSVTKGEKLAKEWERGGSFQFSFTFLRAEYRKRFRSLVCSGTFMNALLKPIIASSFDRDYTSQRRVRQTGKR